MLSVKGEWQGEIRQLFLKNINQNDELISGRGIVSDTVKCEGKKYEKMVSCK